MQIMDEIESQLEIKARMRIREIFESAEDKLLTTISPYLCSGSDEITTAITKAFKAAELPYIEKQKREMARQLVSLALK